MVYIVDTYSKWSKWDREHAVYTFEINGNMYAIKKVEVEWGLPQIQDEEIDRKVYQVYGDLDEVMGFVRKMKRNN